ncbi:MAG: Small subunit (SSU) processome component [Cirrosporium novae-zelandiae]|nr:MAG: Small subunit (SSU) processome component [Cirrosporium novae-zelandiae]
MVRKLKYHEQKLLRKVDFIGNDTADHRAHSVNRRYVIQNPNDYSAYNRICGNLKQLAHRLAALDPADPVRAKFETLMLDKLWDMGLLGRAGGEEGGEGGKAKLSEVERKLGVSAFARRRLGVVMTRIGMVQTVQTAIKFIEQGHVRVGPEVVTDPAFLVTRNMEDFVTWVDSSKIKRNILKYRDNLDDFELL